MNRAHRDRTGNRHVVLGAENRTTKGEPMNLKVNVAAAAIAVGVTGAVLLGVNTVGAQSNGNSLVEKIASRFSLDESEVQAVFDEHKEERHVQRQEKMSEHLQELVDNGTITTEQKALIETEQQKLQDAMDELRPDDRSAISEDEREALHDEIYALRESFESTLEDNGIDLNTIRPEHGRHKGGMGRGGNF